jgi:hypothetical protein
VDEVDFGLGGGFVFSEVVGEKLSEGGGVLGGTVKRPLWRARPCLRRFWDEMAFPSSVFGPQDLRAFSRLAARRAGVISERRGNGPPGSGSPFDVRWVERLLALQRAREFVGWLGGELLRRLSGLCAQRHGEENVTFFLCSYRNRNGPPRGVNLGRTQLKSSMTPPAKRAIGAILSFWEVGLSRLEC